MIGGAVTVVLAAMSQADAVVMAALVTAVGGVITAGFSFVGKRVNQIRAEFTPNNGSSMKDAVNRLELRAAILEQSAVDRDVRLARVERTTERVEAGVGTLLDHVGITQVADRERGEQLARVEETTDRVDEGVSQLIQVVTPAEP